MFATSDRIPGSGRGRAGRDEGRSGQSISRRPRPQTERRDMQPERREMQQDMREQQQFDGRREQQYGLQQYGQEQGREQQREGAVSPPASRGTGYTHPGSSTATHPLTARLVAVQQLLRIEQEGAYSGLLGSPSTAQQLAVDDGQGSEELDQEPEVAAQPEPPPPPRPGSALGARAGAGAGAGTGVWSSAGEGAWAGAWVGAGSGGGAFSREAEGAWAGAGAGAGAGARARAGTERRASPKAAPPEKDAPQSIRADLQEAGSELSPDERRTLRQLVSGVTRWRRRLDYVISSLVGKSAAALEPSMRQVLRLGIYELTNMSLAPHAVNEFVELARHFAGHEGAPRLANGVLRAAVRAVGAGNLPSPEAELEQGAKGRDLLRCLSIQHSHPTWLTQRWLTRFGREGVTRLMQHNNRPPMFTARLNSLAGLSLDRLMADLERDGVVADPSPLLPSEYIEVKTGLQTLLQMGYVSRGFCTIQDVAQGLVVRLALNPQPGERVLDCCAAPGGKTVYTAARMLGKGSVTAVDISSAKVTAIKRLASACRVPLGMVRLVAADFREWAAEQAPAAAQGQRWDRVLLDVPCSGTGVLAKRADLRWRRSAEDLAQLSILQAELLDAAAPLVKPGGVLVYSTCSIEPEEGEAQVAAFLDRHPAYQLSPLTPEEAKAVGAPASVLSSQGFLQTLPHVHGSDGAFAARFVRSG